MPDGYKGARVGRVGLRLGGSNPPADKKKRCFFFCDNVKLLILGYIYLFHLFLSYVKRS